MHVHLYSEISCTRFISLGVSQEIMGQSLSCRFLFFLFLPKTVWTCLDMIDIEEVNDDCARSMTMWVKNYSWHVVIVHNDGDSDLFSHNLYCRSWPARAWTNRLGNLGSTIVWWSGGAPFQTEAGRACNGIMSIDAASPLGSTGAVCGRLSLGSLDPAGSLYQVLTWPMISHVFWWRREDLDLFWDLRLLCKTWGMVPAASQSADVSLDV